MYLKSAERVNMVDSSFKFLLKEKDSREIGTFPLRKIFFPYSKFNTFFKNQHTQHPMSSQCFFCGLVGYEWLHTRYSSLF